MGNSTNLTASIQAAKGHIVQASTAISTATTEFVALAQEVEQKVKELAEKEQQLHKKEEELARKQKELEDKKGRLDERETGLQRREQQVIEQEKSWVEFHKNVETYTSTLQQPLRPRSYSREGTHTPPRPATPENGVRVGSSTTSTSSTTLEVPTTNVTTVTINSRSRKLSCAPLPTNLDHHPQAGDVINPDPSCTNLLPPALASFKLWLPTRTFSLIYKATRDGFGKGDFHEICDNKGPTIALIQTDRGYMFGGYAPISWGRNEGYDTHPECFLFTLSNPHGLPPTQYKLKAGNAYGLRNSQHVSFGWCGDIKIADDNANQTTESCTNFARSYNDTSGKGPSTFTGESKFKVQEIEVYLVL